MCMCICDWRPLPTTKSGIGLTNLSKLVMSLQESLILYAIGSPLTRETHQGCMGCELVQYIN